jgi:hypothetical protein
MLPEAMIVVGQHDFDSEIKGVKADRLKRKAAGRQLTNLVSSFRSPTVIAFDGPWGSGKSHQ